MEWYCSMSPSTSREEYSTPRSARASAPSPGRPERVGGQPAAAAEPASPPATRENEERRAVRGSVMSRLMTM